VPDYAVTTSTTCRGSARKLIDTYATFAECRPQACYTFFTRSSTESLRGFYRKAHPAENAPQPSECRVEGSRWACALEEQKPPWMFDLDRTLVADYASFARSFTQIRARDIRDQVDAIYASQRFWPEPLITINPHFEQGASVEALVADGSLHPDVARVFRVDGQSITLYRHQMQSVAKATARQSFAVTTGTGSGKSLCFFIPIIDAAIRTRAFGGERRTRAIVIYPMNALANSQREELNKFLDQCGLPENLRPTFERYAGQESCGSVG
jgi:hypothetical protein